jgi:group I intron endonuclease
MGELYRVTAPSGKAYVGITSQTTAKRWWKHKNNASHGRGVRYGSECTALYEAIRKYGCDKFTVETLVIAEFEYLKALEQRAIVAFGTKAPGGYNLTSGGDGALGAVPTQDARHKMSTAQHKRLENPEELRRVRESISRANAIKVTGWWALSEEERVLKREEHAAKLAVSDRFTPEVRAKMSSSQKGKKRTPWSAERKAKASEKRKQEWADPALRQKRVDGFKAAHALRRGEVK